MWCYERSRKKELDVGKGFLRLKKVSCIHTHWAAENIKNRRPILRYTFFAANLSKVSFYVKMFFAFLIWLNEISLFLSGLHSAAKNRKIVQ